jgi:hypothetical protein
MEDANACMFGKFDQPQGNISNQANEWRWNLKLHFLFLVVNI